MIDTSIHAERIALLKDEAIHCQKMAESYSNKAVILRLSEGWNSAAHDDINYYSREAAFWSNLAVTNLTAIIGDGNK